MSGAGLPVIATWYPDADGDGTPDGPAVATQTLATTASAGTIVGQVLWPGAAVDENGVGIAWPGWRRASFGETPMWENYVLDPTLPEAVLLDGVLVVISINPEAAISLAYPDGDVDLLPALEVDKAVDRSAAHRAEQITYTLTVRSAGYGATDDVVLRDELPAAPRVLEVEVADQADPTQPPWDCRVTDQNDDGYAEVLEAADAATFVVVLSAAELLALTGADASTMSWTAVLLVVLGLAVAVVARRRRA